MRPANTPIFGDDRSRDCCDPLIRGAGSHDQATSSSNRTGLSHQFRGARCGNCATDGRMEDPGTRTGGPGGKAVGSLTAVEENRCSIKKVGVSE